MKKVPTYRTQKYCCCRLIAAINARIFLGGGDIEEELFEELADLVCCRVGAAIQVHRAYPKLGLLYEDGPLELDWIKEHLPVELCYYDSRFGFHAVLVTEVLSDYTLMIVNGSRDTIFWHSFLKFRPPKTNKHFQTCRSFK